MPPRVPLIVECTHSVPVVKTPRLLQLLGLFDVPPTERSEQTFRVQLPIHDFE